MHDLTQPISESIPRFPGDPEVRIEALRDSPPWQISRITMGTHSGTHMDAPRHLFSDGPALGGFQVARLIGGGFVINANEFGENQAIDESCLDRVRERVWPGWFAVFRTGWDRYWTSELYFRHPFLSAELARMLVGLEAGLVAVDALSVDSTVSGGSNAHEILLGAGTPIVENLCRVGELDTAKSYMFACLPLALPDADGAPARVVAWTPDELAASNVCSNRD